MLSYCLGLGFFSLVCLFVWLDHILNCTLNVPFQRCILRIHIYIIIAPYILRIVMSFQARLVGLVGLVELTGRSIQHPVSIFMKHNLINLKRPQLKRCTIWVIIHMIIIIMKAQCGFDHIFDCSNYLLKIVRRSAWIIE